ncbi:MAG: T9SS type A sorting domain-containing protein [Bacteroidales bacterium]|nr:T9SS type A sorting domain-containing protein [Bacteroidales bacterium]MCF8397345.1 T9SS type A sorting domain-containing protein [Bacteroidales bacterium]
MKKTLLFLMALCISGLVYAQNMHFEKVSTKLPDQEIVDLVGLKSSPITSNFEKSPSQTYYVNGRELTFVQIGSSGNAYGFYGGPRTYLWADNVLNSVVFTHRMVNDPPTSYGNSRIAYDVSWEGGMDGTWTNSIQVYDPLGPGSQYPDAAGRYPQGGIINPPGNTDPNMAEYTYFIPALDGSNGTSNWGGFAFGTNGLTEVDPADPTQTNWTSGGDTWRNVPDAFTITQDGVCWMIDGSFPNGLVGDYEGQFIFDKGTWNEDIGDVEYEEWLVDILDAGDGINDVKVAFAPDGQIGYLLVMSDSPSDPQPFTNYHPILYTTDDGGETWSDDPMHCQLGGEEGIESVKSFVSDEVMEAIYGAGFNRDEIFYNMGFQVDMVVDYFGNPHITGIIACASEDGWYPNYESMGTFHVWYDVDNAMWDAELLYMNKTLDGDLGGITQYNRPQASSSMDGWNIFFSWIDTDQEGIEENVSPDIYMVHYDVGSGLHSDVDNITSFTQAMWTAYMGSQSHYVFQEDLGNGTYRYTIPFVYTELDPNDPAAEVTFWYIDGVTTDFLIGVDEQENIPVTVEQNYPNPFSSSTTIDLSLDAEASLSLEIFNMTGQKIMEVDKGKVNAGKHQFMIDAGELSKGVYFYTVKANGAKVTRKMIIE